MITIADAQILVNGGGAVVTADGTTLGVIGTIFLDALTGDPAWVTALGQHDGASEPVVPLHAASISGTDVAVAFSRQQIDDAPHVVSSGHLAPSSEDALLEYYGLGDRGHSQLGRHDRVKPDPQSELTDRAPVSTGDDAVVVRSEEQLQVRKETVESGRVRLRKYIVTEDVTLTVQVSREEVRLERDPVDDLAHAQVVAGGEVGEQIIETTLHAQRPVVTMETMAVERVRLFTHVVTEQVDVVDQVHKEQVDIDGAAGERGP